MKEFNEEHIKDLQEVDGFVLQDVKGKAVAIGLDSEYPDAASFILDYIREYSLWYLSYVLGYKDEREMLNRFLDMSFNYPFPGNHIESKLMGAFNGTSADDYAKKLEEKQWHLGDIVEDDEGRKAMIIKDADNDYVLMNVNSKDENAFKTRLSFNWSSSLSNLQSANPEWHKVVED